MKERCIHLVTPCKSCYVETIDYHRTPQYCQELLSHFPEEQKQFMELALCSERYPNGKNCPPVHLLTVESLREQLMMAKAKDPENFNRQLQGGFVLKTDLIKLLLYNQFGDEAVGDQMIALHTEILLALGERLNTRVLPGIYSGDENLSIVLTDKLTETEIRSNLEQIIEEYLTKGPLALKYSLIHSRIKEIHPDFQPGITIEIAKINGSKVTKPKDDHTHLREGSLFASMIDCCEGKTPNPDSMKLEEAILATLLSPRTTSDRYKKLDLSLLYPKARELFDQLDTNDPNYDLYKSYLELGIYEPFFPGELEVMRISTLESYLRGAIEQGNWITLFRVGDPNVKGANKHSHLLGDYHMIATVRILRKYLRQHDYDPNIIQVRKHFGSFLLTLANPANDPDNLILKLSRLLNDPEPLNKTAILTDLQWGRYDSPSRALPYSVVTTYTQDPSGRLVPLIFKNIEELGSLWEKVDTQKKLHSGNETIGLYLASKLLHVHGNQVRPKNAPGEHLSKKAREARAKSAAEMINQRLAQLSTKQISFRPTREQLLAYDLRPVSFVYYADRLRRATCLDNLFA